MADLDPESLNKLRVVDLKKHLSNRGLSTSGLKAELVSRLRDAILSDQNESESNSPMEVDDDNVPTEGDENEESGDEIIDETRKAEEEARLQAEEEARLQAEEEARLQTEEDARLKAEEDARLKAEENARLKAEEDARLKAEEDARLKAEEDAKFKAEEEARLREEEKARLRAEEARLQAEKEARLQAEEKARLQAEEEARLKAEEEARLKAEEEARLKAEEEARLKAKEQARLRAEEQARLKAEEETRLRAKEEARLKAEEETRLRAKEEARLKAEEETRLRAEREAKIKAEEEAMLRAKEVARLKAEEEAAANRKAEVEARKRADEEARLKAEKEASKRAEEEAKRKAEQEAKIKAEQEAKIKAELEAKIKAEQEAKIKAEKEAKRRAEEEAKLIAEVGARQKAHEARVKAEREARIKAEEEARLKAEKDAKLKAERAEEEAKLRDKELRKKSDNASFKAVPPPSPAAILSNMSSLLLPPGTSPDPILSAMPLSHVSPPMGLFQQSSGADFNGRNSSNLEFFESMDTTDDLDSEIKLPQAIEKVLALKTERVQLHGTDSDTDLISVSKPHEKNKIEKQSMINVRIPVDDEESLIEEDVVSNKSKETKNKRRKKKKKKRSAKTNETRHPGFIEKPVTKTATDIDIEYVQEVIDIADPMYSQFLRIFERFKLVEGDKDQIVPDTNKDSFKIEPISSLPIRKMPLDMDDDDDDDDDEKDDDKVEEKPKLSKRKLKKLSRMSVAELKQKVNRPELVEMHDVTAKDPVLLLHLKASRNTVPVPRHWCFKRKYLQGKRGIEKPAFELPDFIKKTGIMEMRQALQEKEDQKTMKAKMRERVRPKLGKIDIDYQKLHDAFFKWQTKPKMTIHGDLYYEGKEFETRLKEKKPGDLSEDLRTALGMPTGVSANKCPPPWLIAMQRYGPPPSYPNLKIPGLNAPIPDSCSFGYHAGGWGKPPVDEAGRPLYGDVFGTQIADNLPHIQEEVIDHTLWGELESESSEEEEDEDEDEDEDEEEKVEDESGLVTPAEGLITPSGFSSIPTGMETPDMIELRKRKIEAEMEGGDTPALYTILPEKKTERVGAAMMGSTHIYDMTAAIPSKMKVAGTSSVAPQGVEVALDPSELEMDSAAMAARYEQTMREQQSHLQKEDLSDMVAEHAARQKNKRKKQQMDSAKPPKKYKEFKF